MAVKENRISKKKEFDDIFKNGKTSKGVFLIVKYLKNKLTINRFAFLISKKISSKAYIRNKIRRMICESVKNKDVINNTGMDLIFIALAGVKNKKFEEIKKETDALLNKTK